MKKGSHMTIKQRKKVSDGLKGNVPWNKGMKTITEPACKRLRRDGNYRINELRLNALRNQRKGYDRGRMDEIAKASKERQERCGHFPVKLWSEYEIKYLHDNYTELTIEEMAKHLQRSWISVSHKLSRLRLIVNNKWI